jgi:hypothetical protein
MPLSLADRILSYRDVGGRRGTTRKAVEAEGSREPGPAARDAGGMPGTSDAARMRGLFGVVARDWSGLVGAVSDLKKALVGSAVEQAIGAGGVQGGEVEALPRGTEEMP